jgi:hypothetical protein
MSDEEREAIKDRLLREHFRKDSNSLKDDLETPNQREKFVREQGEALSTLVSFISY